MESGRDAGEVNLHECLEYRFAGSDGWVTGGMSTLKTKKTALRTGTRLECGWGETTWTTRDNFCKVRRLNGRRLGARASCLRGKGWDVGGKKKTNRTKGDKVEREDGSHLSIANSMIMHYI